MSGYGWAVLFGLGLGIYLGVMFAPQFEGASGDVYRASRAAGWQEPN